MFSSNSPRFYARVARIFILPIRQHPGYWIWQVVRRQRPCHVGVSSRLSVSRCLAQVQLCLSLGEQDNDVNASLHSVRAVGGMRQATQVASEWQGYVRSLHTVEMKRLQMRTATPQVKFCCPVVRRVRLAVEMSSPARCVTICVEHREKDK
jgi:hypothetical protein